MTSDFEGFPIPDFTHYIYFPILILEKEPVFSLLNFSAKQRHYWLNTQASRQILSQQQRLPRTQYRCNHLENHPQVNKKYNIM